MQIDIEKCFYILANIQMQHKLTVSKHFSDTSGDPPYKSLGSTHLYVCSGEQLISVLDLCNLAIIAYANSTLIAKLRSSCI